MPRYVLLGLAGKDVDVLSRLSRMDPRPEVLVVHPDPGALILRLADVAQMPALTEPPRPRADDVVVVSSAPHEEVAEWAKSWREVGARIVLPDGLQRASEVSPAVHAAVSAQAAAAASALSAMTPMGRGSVAEAPPVAQAPSNPPEEKPVTHVERGASPMGNGSDHPADPVPAPRPKPRSRRRRADPEPGSATAWESPEATFRYLVEQALGRDAAITLWWNGSVDAWVPWVWTGASPGARPQDSGDVLPLRTECGEFQVSGAGERRGQLNPAALARVAEDMALRDLMRWRREARALTGHGLPDPQADRQALAGWIAPVMVALEWRGRSGVASRGRRVAVAARRGRRPGIGWDVHHPRRPLRGHLRGGDVRRGGAGSPQPDLRVHLQVKGDDPRWPLRLRRVQLALAGEETAW